MSKLRKPKAKNKAPQKLTINKTKIVREKEISSIYLHVGNSGATISVVDKGLGPTIRLRTSAFGNLENILEIHTTKAGLEALCKVFAIASAHDYSKEYCHAADTLESRDSKSNVQSASFTVNDSKTATYSSNSGGTNQIWIKTNADSGNVN